MSQTIEIASTLKEVLPAAWDALTDGSNPFVSHAFLSSLEDAGCTTAQTGWQPHHILLRNNDELAGAVICYRKTHSMGEYVFDHGWAEAFQRAGGRYYPKLQVSIPFTPASGPRLLATDPAIKVALAMALEDACLSASSVHTTFVTEEDTEIFSARRWLLREDVQFHWENSNYKTFADFLAVLSSSKRKNIRKERAAFEERSITFEALTGEQLQAKHWECFYAFYMDTGSRKWGQPYLNRKFFELIHQRMPEKIALIMAKRKEKYIAGALNFIGHDTLYGRNWGCLETHPFLHFETCYYQAIDFAIAHGLQRVEAGAQGEHKLARGYLPVKTRSLHYIRHPGLRNAIKDFLEEERTAIDREQHLLSAHAPFRREPANEQD
jgi:uncharacterized protein